MTTHTRTRTRKYAALAMAGMVALGSLSACAKDDEAEQTASSTYGDGATGDLDANANDQADAAGADANADIDPDALIVDTDGDGVADAPAGTPGTVVGPNAGKDGNTDGAARGKRGGDNGDNGNAGGGDNAGAGGNAGNAGGNAGGDTPSIKGNDAAPVPAPETKPIERVENGKPGSDKDREEITAMLNGVYKQETVGGLTRAIGDNTCKRVVKESGGEDAFNVQQGADVKFSDLGIDVSQNGVIALDDFQVKGKDASAMVKAKTYEGEDQALMRFAKEGGQWKMCN